MTDLRCRKAQKKYSPRFIPAGGLLSMQMPEILEKSGS